MAKQPGHPALLSQWTPTKVLPASHKQGRLTIWLLSNHKIGLKPHPFLPLKDTTEHLDNLLGAHLTIGYILPVLSLMWICYSVTSTIKVAQGLVLHSTLNNFPCQVKGFIAICCKATDFSKDTRRQVHCNHGYTHDQWTHIYKDLVIAKRTDVHSSIVLTILLLNDSLFLSLLKIAMSSTVVFFY